MKNFNLSEAERYIKRCVKGKMNFTKALVITFLMTGYFSYSSDLWIEYKGDLNSSGDLNEGTGVWNSKKDMTDPKNREATILSSGNNRAGSATSLRNKDFNETVVIGSRTVGGGGGATSIGYRAIVGKNDGNIQVSNSHQGTAVGYRTFAYGNEATSIGNDTVAYGESSISIGSDNIGFAGGKNPYARKALSYDIWELFYENGAKFNYTNEYSTVNGHGQNKSNYKNLYNEYLKLENDQTKPNWKTHNWAYGDSSIAIGSRNVAYGYSSVALGTSSIAKGNFSTALGTGTLAFGDSSVALGNEVYIYSNQSAGVGNNVQALEKGSMVYGLNSYSGGEGSVAIGERALSNVQIKGEHTNIVNDAPELVQLEKLYDGDPNDNQDKTYKKLAKLDENRENLYNAQTELQPGTGEYKAIKNKANGAVAIGYFVIASGENSLALGRQSYSKGERSVAIGPYSYAKGANSFALGYGSKAIEKDTFAIGSYSRADGKNSIALGVEAKVLNNSSDNNLNGENSLALGNESEVKMRNSVALGYKSTTKYYYKDNKYKNEHSIDERDKDNNAINLKGYIPEGSSYDIEVNENDGIISVGAWDKGGKVGLRRIVGVAAGALDTDVATVGQLKALQYTKKEGVVTYYTQEGDKIYKVIKATDGKFYKVNTDNGTPLDDKEIDKTKVFAGPKGFNEQIINVGKKKTSNMGERIKFGNLSDGEISPTSDQAITGGQLDSVKEVLGADLKSSNTKFEKPSFNAIEYEGSQKRTQNTFKGAITETITAINKGYKFSDGTNNETQFLGSTVEIVNGDINNNYKAENLETKLEKSGSKATFKIGLKEEPTFKKVKITGEVKENQDAVNKQYLDTRLANVAANFTISGNAGTQYEINKDNAKLIIKGKEVDSHRNITTTTKTTGTKELEIELNNNLKGIETIKKDENTKIEFNNSDGLKLSSKGTELKLKSGELNLNNKKITGIVAGAQDNDAVNYKQLKDQQIHYVSVNYGTDKLSENYNNNGAKANKAIAIGVGASADVPNSVVIGSNINVTQRDAKNVKDAVIAIGSGVNLKNSKSSIVMGTVYEGEGDGDRTTVDEAAWALVLGNKTQVKGGSDIVALGNNMTVSKENNTGNNNNLVILGNKATAKSAEKSVVIGYEAKSTSTSAVAIGSGSKVENNAGDSIAIGNGSEAKAKEEAKKEAKTSKDVKFAFKGGISNGAGDKKTVFSIGKSGKERIIKNVAAGEVSENSTDAINGSQLYSVANEFSKLAVDVLGAEAETTTGFKKSKFKQLIGGPINSSSPEIEKTFKQAISDNIDKINQGFTFSDGTNKGQRYFGQEVTIQAGNIDAEAYKSDNIKVNYGKNRGTFLIGIKKDPTFEKVTLSKQQIYGTNGKDAVSDEDLISKRYLDKALENVASSFTVAGDVANSGTETSFKIDDTLNINGESNITTKIDKDNKKVIVTLKDSLTDISSITSKNVTGNSNSNLKTEIKFNQSNSGVGDTNLTIISNGAKYAFGPQGVNLNNKPIKGLKGALEGNSDTNLGYILSNTSNENNGYGNIKNQAVNVEDLAKVASKIIDKGLSFEGDSGTVTRKLGESLKIVGEKATDTLNSGSSTTTIATAPGNISVKNKSNSNDTLEIGLAKELKGISSIENEKDNSNVKLEADKATLSAGNNKANVEVGEDSVKLTSATDKILTYNSEGKLSGLEAGKIATDSKEAITGKQLNDLGSKLGLEVETNKTEFTSPTFIKLKDTTGNDAAKAPTTFKDAIDKNIETLNKGFKLAGDKNKAGTTGSETQYLGSTININAGDITDNSTSYKGKNLKTEYSYAGGNGTIKIGLTENPEFKSVEFNNGEDDAKIAKISTDKDGNISILTQATKDNTGKTVEIKGDTVTGVNKVGADDKNNISFEAAKAKITVDGSAVEFKKSTTTDETDKILISNVASPIGDYDAANKKYVDDQLAKSSDALKNSAIKFEGDKAGTFVDAKLGETLKIKGKVKDGETAPEDSKLSNGNIGIVVDETNPKDKFLKVGLAKDLTDLSSAEFTSEEYRGGNTGTKQKVKATINGSGTKIVEVEADGSDKQGGKTASYLLDKIELKEGDKINSSAAEGNIISEGSDTLENTAKGITLKYIKTGEKEIISIKNKDGKGTIDFAQKDGKITGLAEITDKDTGDTAVNKNYVDKKLAKADADSPIETIYRDKDGNELEKHGDNYYPKNTIPEGAKYDEEKGKFVDKDGKELPEGEQPRALEEEEAKKVNEEVHLKGKSKKITNVDSGIGLDKVEVPDGTTPDKQKEELEKAKKEAAKDFIDNKLDAKKAKNAVNAEDLHTVANVIVGKGMDFKGDYSSTDKSDDNLIHNKLGEALNIKGKIAKDGTAVEKAKLTGGNIGVIADKNSKTLSIGLSEELKNLKSAEFTTEKDSKTITTKVDGEGTTIKGADGKSAEYKLDGSKVVNGDKSTATTAEGTTVTDGINTTEVKADGTTVKGENGKNADYKADGITIKKGDKDTDKVLEIKNKDGNGEINFATTETDGKKVGTGKITGLADLKDNADGTSATNKNYVDEKFKASNEKIDAINNNVPVIYTDDKGHKVVKGKDGKFYTVDDTGKPTNKEVPADKVFVSVKDGDKINSGLGLTNKTPIEDAKEKVNKLLGNKIPETENLKSNDPILNNVATVIDLQALGKAGIDFVGNDGKTLVHRNLGQTLTIKGAGTTDTNFAGADGNINVKGNTLKDGLEIELSKRLKNIELAVFEKEVEKADGNKVKVTNTVDADGSTLKGKDGITAEYKVDGAKVADKNGNTTEVRADGTTVTAKDGKTSEYKAGSAKLTDGDKSTETTADGITIKKGDKDTDKVLEIKNNNGNGEINFATTETDGKKVGTGKITGLADLDETSDATSAVNKNYVDSRIKDLADSSPIKYVDEEGKDLVKGKDGKIYRPEDIKDKKYVDGKGYVKDPEDKKEKLVDDVKDAKAILDPNIKLDGVKSGIGLDKAIVEPSMTEAEKEAAKKAKKETADNFINNPLNEKDAKNAVNVEDLHEVSKSIIDKGISFGADKGEATHKALGQTIKVNGGKNINTEIKGGNIEVNLDDKIILEEVKTGDSTLNTNGLKVSGPTKKALTEDEAKAKGLTEADRVKAEDDGFEQDDDGKYFYYLPETGAKYEKDGTSIKGENGKSAEYKLNGATIKNEQGSAVFSPTSLTFNDNDGNSKVKIDGATASMSVGKVNVDGEKATITGLADLNENSHGSSATNKNYVDSKLGNLEEKVTGEIGSASALNAALAALKPLSYDPLRKSQFSAGMGMYKGQTAFALGLNHYTSENTLINGGVSFASGSNINNRRDIMFNLGFTHKFGSKADIDKLPVEYQAGPISSIYAMQDEMQELREHNKKLENENASLKARLDKIEKMLMK